ncbi:ATP-binding protein [Melioribacteraceae bacterium 4301-Me]|uniref:sensor histidine kinase n=1 Tax=Pyranulibacter aquaticus TaxID=3163344 RepID=UPI003595FB30
MRKFFPKNKISYIIAILFILILLCGAIAPIITNNITKNWSENLREKIDGLETRAKEKLREKENNLLTAKNNLTENFHNLLTNDTLNKALLFSKLSSDKYNSYSIELWDDSLKLLAWNENVQNEPILNLNYNPNETYFYTTSLISYLAVFDTIQTNQKKFFLAIALPLEKHYNFNGNYYKPLSIQNELSKELSTPLKIFFSPFVQRSKDGREYSFDLLNNFNNKIGLITIEKPSREAELQNVSKLISNIQKSLAVTILIVLLIFLYLKLNKKNRISRIVVLSVFVLITRILLFVMNVPSDLVKGDITNSSYFSSTFGGGIVKSPLDLFITLFLLLLIILEIYQSTNKLEENKNTLKNSKVKFFLQIILSCILILLSLRGLGASVRSIIFDSTLRYFKEYTLFPDIPTALMLLNLLILGFIIFLFSLTLLLFSFKNFYLDKKQRKVFIIGSFIFFQISGWIYDALQSNPQGTSLIRIIFISLIFFFSYLILEKKIQAIFQYLLYSIGASVITIALLIYYNSELEKESLKVVAQDITRTNESFLEFMIQQTISSAPMKYDLGNKIIRNSNLAAIGFVIWTESLLYKEGIPCNIDFFDSTGNYIDGFSLESKQDSEKFLKKIYMSKQPAIIKENNLFNSDIRYTGVSPIFLRDNLIGYILIETSFNSDFIPKTEIPKFLEFSREGITSAINLNKMKAFIFHNDTLTYSFGNLVLNKHEINSITKAPFNNFNESWQSIIINGEKNLVYSIKESKNNTQRIVSVALEERNFSWNLFDFFKVFFFHILIITMILITLSFVYYKAVVKELFSFRTRLTLALLIISIIPLIIMAVYFRNITEEKNSALIINKLDERSHLVEKYLNRYLLNTDLNEYTILQKAKDDIGINYSVYKNGTLVFSTQKNFYDIGLFSKYLNPSAYFKLLLEGMKESLTKAKIENYDYNKLYYKAKIAGEDFIFEINDLFNSLLIPLSDVEINIALFGSYSLVVIIIFVISTILANQISAPIRKLTKATKSVASGDLSVEVIENNRGEIKELIDGFNQMVKGLRINQIELSRLERENAWKEMAKQVAHEIKNPLTPMKLSVQQLIAAYKDKSPKLNEIFDKVTSILISQIETLRNIATEFSNFARMPSLKLESVDIIAAAKESVILFSEEPTKVILQAEHDSLIVEADFDQLKRTFINLIRNSIQADSSLVKLLITTTANDCEIRIIDNGKGIPKEHADKIFENNFTTKEKGMGIGLTLAKRFIEGINGTITLEKSSNEGTTFLIKIPVKKNT